MKSFRVLRLAALLLCYFAQVGHIAFGQSRSLGFNATDSQPDIKPESLVFRRQATRRMVFDQSQDIPLGGLAPSEIIGLDVMHPVVGSQKGQIENRLGAGKLVLSAAGEASACRWVGAMNPFASYDLSLHSFAGSGRVGIRFSDSENEDHLSASILISDGKYQSVEWEVFRDNEVIDRQGFSWPKDFSVDGPIRLRVQMLAVGVNLYLESSGQFCLIGYSDFAQHFDLRRKDLARRFEFCLHTHLDAGASAEILGLRSALTPGCGQADIRAITNQFGEPLLDEGRVWLTMTVRGRALPHPLQGVFSMNPSVFDIRFEGIIVFDMGDGLLRNELASHLFFDEPSRQWRGWTTGFSALGTTTGKEAKAILAISSDRDPRRGFSVMKASPIGVVGEHEDPHGVYDVEAKKWRLLLSERAGKYRAGIWESDHWDRGYERLAGPVEMDSTGTLIQKIGRSRFVFFGSADRKVYICSYPDLNRVGELQIHRPPWNEQTGTRIWPNIIPLPEGYPAPFIAIMMDRVNFPGMPSPNWTYGAMYLYHAHP
ncbi:hypothetical protein [Neorhodopirellula pilleata]|nr:hypothetical protein [Neorhodopirellula pilleata]